jgi:hypothetical protein
MKATQVGIEAQAQRAAGEKTRQDKNALKAKEKSIRKAARRLDQKLPKNDGPIRPKGIMK